MMHLRPVPDYEKSVEWQKLYCFEVKRAYSISNGALVCCLCVGCFVVVFFYKNFFISYYRDEIHGWYNSDYVQSGQIEG